MLTLFGGMLAYITHTGHEGSLTQEVKARKTSTARHVKTRNIRKDTLQVRTKLGTHWEK